MSSAQTWANGSEHKVNITKYELQIAEFPEFLWNPYCYDQTTMIETNMHILS